LCVCPAIVKSHVTLRAVNISARCTSPLWFHLLAQFLHSLLWKVPSFISSLHIFRFIIVIGDYCNTSVFYLLIFLLLTYSRMLVSRMYFCECNFSAFHYFISAFVLLCDFYYILVIFCHCVIISIVTSILCSNLAVISYLFVRHLLLLLFKDTNINNYFVNLLRAFVVRFYA